MSGRSPVFSSTLGVLDKVRGDCIEKVGARKLVPPHAGETMIVIEVVDGHGVRIT